MADGSPHFLADEAHFSADDIEHKTILDVFNNAVKNYRDQTAFTCMGATLSFGELDRLSGQFANYLRASGLEPGDRIAIQLPNILQFPMVLYGAFRAGLIVVNVNPLFTQTELAHVFEDSEPKALVVFANVAHVAAKAVRGSSVKQVIVTEIADLHPTAKRLMINTVVKRIKKMIPPYHFTNATTLRAALHAGRRPHGADHIANPQDTLMLQYTGGTTGVAKAAVLTNASLSTNLEQYGATVDLHTQPGKDIWIAPMPLYHIFGFCLNLAFLPSRGGHSVLIPNPRDIPGMIKQLQGIRFTGFAGINTLIVALTNDPDFRKLDFSGLKVTVAGGAPMTKDAMDTWLDITGCTVAEGYGLSECSPLVTTNRTGFEIQGSIGFPIPGTEIRIVDTDDKPLPGGEPGELQVRDDNGSLRIVDRMKDMALISGFNVFPVEVDNVASGMPGILECASIGVPDRKTGEALWLFAIKQDPSLSEADVRAYCREYLTAYKVPSRVIFVDDLPKSAVGKMLRRELRVVFAEHFPPEAA